MNIIWNAIICTAHFYISITNQEYSYEYGLPSMSFFLLFSIFELRLLFFAWRARHADLQFSDQNEFKRRLFRFYTFFYILLFFGLIFSKYLFSNFWISLLVFSCTWIFQIIHSATTGTRPPMNLKYLIVITIGKLFLPVYIYIIHSALCQSMPL